MKEDSNYELEDKEMESIDGGVNLLNLTGRDIPNFIDSVKNYLFSNKKESRELYRDRINKSFNDIVDNIKK